MVINNYLVICHKPIRGIKRSLKLSDTSIIEVDEMCEECSLIIYKFFYQYLFLIEAKNYDVVRKFRTDRTRYLDGSSSYSLTCELVEHQYLNWYLLIKVETVK